MCLPNPVFSVLSLVLCFVSSAIVLVLSGSEFLGLTIVVVYVGAIAVLFLFVVMMLDLHQFSGSTNFFRNFSLPFFGGVYLFFSSLGTMFFLYPFYPFVAVLENWFDYTAIAGSHDDIVSLSVFLFNHFYFSFLLAGFLLFVALLGSIVITLRRRRFLLRQRVTNQIKRPAALRFYSRSSANLRAPEIKATGVGGDSTARYGSSFYALVGFQSVATPIREGIVDLHNYIFIYLTFIFFFVFAIFYSIVDTFLFSSLFPSTHDELLVRKASVFSGPYLTHFPTLEIVWTVLPGFVLLAIALPSFTLLYAMDEVIDPSLTLKALGHQWYWSYEYSDLPFGSVSYDSYMLDESALPLGGLRLLEVDNSVVLPSLTHIRVLVTSEDVLHSWRVPSLGVKVDAVPGRLNQLSVYARREGVFYGQCSELCGVNHGFMPISVRIVSLKEFLTWRSSILHSIQRKKEIFQCLITFLLFCHWYFFLFLFSVLFCFQVTTLGILFVLKCYFFRLG